jgi:hypothetical protein
MLIGKSGCANDRREAKSLYRRAAKSGIAAGAALVQTKIRPAKFPKISVRAADAGRW